MFDKVTRRAINLALETGNIDDLRLMLRGKVIIDKEEAKKVCDRLEFDASWDKCGSGYYSMKYQIQTEEF